MNINIFNILGNGKDIKTKMPQTSFGIRLSSPLKKDTVEIKKSINYFETKEKAIEHYREIGKQVNESLEEDDELSAFELLGYDISTDFDTDEITINGDYIGHFPIYTGKPLQLHKISYKEVGIDEQKLMQNVVDIQGNISDYSDFEINDNFVIDRKKEYSLKMFEKLDKLMKKRADEIKKAIIEQDYEKAFSLLGYKTTTDENGNITIEGDYTDTVIKGHTRLKDYDINENELLSKVVKVNGNSDIGVRFVPDHFIYTSFDKNSDSWIKNYFSIKDEYVKLDPQYIKTTSKAKEQLANGDNFGALQTLGFDIKRENDGSITILGDFRGEYIHKTAEYAKRIKLSNIGIDEKALIQGVKKIDGNFYISDETEEPLSKDFEATGIVFYYGFEDENLFSNFITEDNISTLYDGIDKDIIKNFIEHGVLKPSFKTMNHSFFGNLEGTNKEFLDEIMARRNEILTADEICEKYALSKRIIGNALKKGELKPFGIKSIKSTFNINPSEYLYDISDVETETKLEKLSHKKEVREKGIKKDSAVIKVDQYKYECRAKRVRAEGENSALTSYPASALEILGFGTKADFVAQCRLRTDSYRLVNYILNNDTYNISTPEMMDVVLSARRSNPAIYNLQDFLNKIGDAKKDVIQAIIDGRIKVIATSPYRLTYYNDYCINLFDENNYECLKNIDSERLQLILSEREEAFKKYRQDNEKYVEQFKSSNITTKEQALKQTKLEFEAIEAQRLEEKRAKEIEKKRQKEERIRNFSLRNTIAWVLCPNTRQIKSELMNPHIRELMTKSKELQEIREELLSREITIEEAEIRINNLNLTQQDKIDILAYHKSTWELAGTEEWSNALKEAKVFMKAYKEQGISGIENEDVRNRVIEWEKTH